MENPALGRTFTYPGPFAKVSATPIRYRRPAPKLGEHDADVAAAWEAPRSDESRRAAPTAVDNPGRADRPAALAGVKVLDFTWVFAGPMGTRPLADYGATVVHVESGQRVDALRTNIPFKDGQPGPERSGGYSHVSAGKLGLMLNLSTPEGRSVALKLAAWADVVVENYSPKAMRAWGLSYDELRAVNPGLIMVSTCLNGQYGPHAGLAGYGTMGAQISGFGYLAGWPDRPPAGPFLAYSDYVSAHYISCAVLAALDHRRRTGEGQYIDIGQVEASIHFLAPTVLEYTANGRLAERAGNDSPEHAPHGVYPATGEDRWVAIACANEQEWHGLCAATGHDEWARDPRFATFAARREHREALDAALGAWTAEREVDAIERTLQAAGVPAHRASTSADLFADPQLRHRNFWVEVEHPELGPVPIDNSHVVLSRTPSEIRWPGPTFGQHNEHVLREILRLTDEEIIELTVAGVLE
jgi:crotonobetainyl-CoA:carnitine CoA-transferase CaiB-like acyl-CoA transferase